VFISSDISHALGPHHIPDKLRPTYHAGRSRRMGRRAE